MEALYKLSQREEAVGQVLNVGTDEEIRILDLARKVKAMTNSSSEIQLIPYTEAYEEGFEDMPRRIPDISRLQRMIGYRPTKDLEQIIRSIVDDQQRRIQPQERVESGRVRH